MAIILDMDEVICDFTGGALGLHGYSWADFEPGGRLASWCGAWGLDAILGLSEEAFWQPINNAGQEFWQSLDLLPWTNELLDMLEPCDWFIATSPAKHVSSHIGKVLWLEEHLPQHRDRAFIARHKHKLAHQGNVLNVLIDDRPQNIATFQQHGGYGILFPSYCNCLYLQRKDPLRYVAQQLEILSCI